MPPRRTHKRRKHKAHAHYGNGNPFPPFDELINKIFSEVFGGQVVSVVKFGIPDDMFRKLLFLCHPDKHNNSETATEVTRWLLEQRKKGGE